MGYYSLSLPEGNHVVNYSFVGFMSQSEVFILNGNIHNSVSLNSDLTIPEIIVIDKDTAESYVGNDYLDLEGLSNYPALLGENDPINIIQKSTGIQSGNESQGGIYVRGSGNDQNLILMDGIPIFEAKHFFGIVSIFNNDVLFSSTCLFAPKAVPPPVM